MTVTTNIAANFSVLLRKNSGLALCILLIGCAGVSNLQDPAVRSGGVTVDDRASESLLRRHIIAEGDKHPLRVKVKVFNRYILLVGETETLAVSESLEVKAAQLKGVRRIFNRLKVENPLPNYKGFEDLILNTRVGFSIKSIQELDGVQIEYITDRNRIYLMGLVTPEQANITTNALSKIKGVQEVITLFEYL